MKKSIFIALFVMTVAAGSAFAQSTQTRALTQDEVPMNVRQAFENDFGTWTEKGFWKVEYTEKQMGKKNVFTPEHYVFNSKRNGEKVRLTFAPDGKLESSKGATAKEAVGNK